LAIYKTVLIIFPLNLQTITITLDVSNGEEGGGGGKCQAARSAPGYAREPRYCTVGFTAVGEYSNNS